MKKIFAILFFITLPSIALAHEKWFINGSLPVGPKPLLFTTWSSVNASLVLLAVFGLVAALLIHFAVRPHRWAKKMRAALGAFAAWAPGVLRTMTGLLLFMGSFSRFLFAPDLSTTAFPVSAERVLLAVQLLIGLGLIIGLFPRFMSSLGFALYFFSIFLFPFPGVINYLFFAGIFIYLFIVGDPALPKSRRVKIFPNAAVLLNLKEAKPFAMAILRFFTGLSFILVGAFYKIADPNFALEFLRMHDVNFIRGMGFLNFTNDMFVLTAGITEVFLGVLIIFGLLPRLVGFILFILFFITLSMFGMYELIGHLPLFAVAFALITQGGGERWSAELSRKRA